MSPYSYLHSSGPPGSDFHKELRATIDQADFFVVLWGAESGDSQWVLSEIDYAIEKNKMILPVLLDRGTQLPDKIANIQAVRAYNDKAGWPPEVARIIMLWTQHAKQNRSSLQTLGQSQKGGGARLSTIGKIGVGAAILGGLAIGIRSLMRKDDDKLMRKDEESEDRE